MKHFILKSKKSIIAFLFLTLLCSCSKSDDSQIPTLPIENKTLKYFNCDFNGLKLRSIDPATPLIALENFGKGFQFHGVYANFINVPDFFNAKINKKGAHFYHQRFFIKNQLDTLRVDINIEFPIIGGESQVFTKKTYETGLFLRDPTIDVPGGAGAKVWSSECPTDESPRPSISMQVFGVRKTDGVYAVTKYWQTVLSVPHNDIGTISIDEIDTVNKTVKGKFSSSISSLYFKQSNEELNKIVGGFICKPELYTVETSTISGEFFVTYKEYE
jgi:hypothetical protein